MLFGRTTFENEVNIGLANKWFFGYERFQEVFGAPPRTYGAAGWQMNPGKHFQLDRYQIQYASDSRAMLKADGSLAKSISSHIA